MKELDIVELTKAFNGVPVGTKGAIVLKYDGDFCEVEFVDDNEDTIDVMTTPMEFLKIVRSI